MNIFKLFKKKRGTGALLDIRSVVAKEKDYLFQEIVTSSSAVVWTEKPQNAWRKFPISDQNGSGSCVAQTLSKMLGIAEQIRSGVFVPFSSSHIYQRRVNRPAAGMGGTDALDIGRKGTTLEVLAPSQNLTDAQMDAIAVEPYKVAVGAIFKVPSYVVLPIKDIETVASIIQHTGKGVMVWFYFNTSGEWSNVPTVQDGGLNMSGERTGRHSVTAVDFTLYNGKKALIIDDSWGLGHAINGQRVITEDFYNVRNFFAAHTMNFQYVETPIVRVLTFMRELSFGMQNTEVVAMQNVLKSEGLFPSNIASTGYYGSITAVAVLAYQKKYVLVQNGRQVGMDMINRLNQ